MACGEILAKLRKERRYTQQKVAAILHVSKSTISNYEKSVYHPPYDILVNFSEMYGVSVDYLLGRTDCRIEIDRLDQKLAYGYTLKNCIDCIMEADKEKTAHLLKYFELTQPDFRKKKRKRGAEKSKAERNKIEKSKEERNKVEQSKAERNKVEESKAERNKVEKSKAERNKVEQSKAERNKIEKSKEERNKVEQSKAERNKEEQSKAERNKEEQSKAERNKVEESKAERHKIETSKEA